MKKISFLMMTTFSGNAYKGPRMPEIIKEAESRGIFADAIGVCSKTDKKVYSTNILKKIRTPISMRFIFKINSILVKIFGKWNAYRGTEAIYSVFARIIKSNGQIVVIKPRPYAILEKNKKNNRIIVVEASENHTRYTQKVLQKELSRIGKNELHNNYTNEEAISEYERTINNADYLLCLSTFSANTYIKNGFPKENIYVVNPFCGNNRILNINNTTKDLQFVSVAHHGILKGTHNLIKLWCKNKYKNKLVLIGTIYEDIKEFVDMEKDNNNIIIMGPMDRNEIFTYYLSHNCVGVLLSLSESFGRVVYEYLSYSIPVIVTETCTCDIVEDGKNGFVVDGQYEEQLDIIVSKYVNMSDEKYINMQKSAYESSVQEDRFGKKYVDALEDIIRKNYEVI